VDSTRTASGNLIQSELLQALVEIFHHLSGADGGALALERIGEYLLTLQDFCAVWIYRKDDPSGEVRLHYHLGLEPPRAEAEQRADFSGCVVDYVFRTGQPMALRDLAHCRRLPSEILHHESAMKAHLAVPIGVEGQTIGVLNVGTRHARRFLIHEIRFLAVVAGAIGQLIQKEQLRRAGEEDRGYMFEAGAQTLVRKLVDGMLIVERDFRVTIWNPAGHSFLEGFTEIEKGECYEQLSHLFPLMLRQLDTGDRVFETEISLSQPPGKCLRVTATPLDMPGGQVARVLVSVKDLTREKVSARKEQLEARVSSVSAFLEGVTHEIYNPLTAVSGYLQILRHKTGDREDLQELVHKMEGELNRCIRLVREMVELGHRRDTARQQVHPGKLVEQVVEESREYLQGTGVSIRLELDRELPMLELERDDFRQAISSLLEFCAHKLRDGSGEGVLHLSAQRIDEVLHIALSDSHPGIFDHPADEEEQIGVEDAPDVQRDYEMPLAFCFRVIRDHGGVMYAQTEPGKGVGYVIELPLLPAAT
jgi:signal transduction histidine kinase